MFNIKFVVPIGAGTGYEYPSFCCGKSPAEAQAKTDKTTAKTCRVNNNVTL